MQEIQNDTLQQIIKDCNTFVNNRFNTVLNEFSERYATILMMYSALMNLKDIAEIEIKPCSDGSPLLFYYLTKFTRSLNLIEKLQKNTMLMTIKTLLKEHHSIKNNDIYKDISEYLPETHKSDDRKNTVVVQLTKKICGSIKSLEGEGDSVSSLVQLGIDIIAKMNEEEVFESLKNITYNEEVC